MVEFEANNQAACDAKMRELCNDGRCWTIRGVFGHITATPHDSPQRVPRVPVNGSQAERSYWQAGKWHKRRPATAAMQRKVQRDADSFAGVSDGANVDIGKWFRQRARKDAQRLRKKMQK